MESMDVAKEPAVKMTGEDLAHAYDAVRVANKSVRFPYLLHFVDTFPLQSYAIIHVCVCVCVSGFWRASCVASAVSRMRS